MAAHSPSTVRSAALRSSDLSLAKNVPPAIAAVLQHSAGEADDTEPTELDVNLHPALLQSRRVCE
jgi:hypothetical protein